MPNLYGPGALNVDISLFKNAQVSEQFQLQFRAEAFNVFNRVQFANPATNITQMYVWTHHRAGQFPQRYSTRDQAVVLIIERRNVTTRRSPGLGGVVHEYVLAA